MQTPFNLRRLRELRQRGQSPSLPVFLTDNWVFNSNLERAGAMSIMVRPEHSQENWEPLAGLNVILNFPMEESWRPLMRSVKDSRPRKLETLRRTGLSFAWGQL